MEPRSDPKAPPLPDVLPDTKGPQDEPPPLVSLSGNCTSDLPSLEQQAQLAAHFTGDPRQR